MNEERMVRRPGLLVSVRSVPEAAAALAGGADIIDIKEPKRGPLGCADPDTIAAILEFVAGRSPVSAAMGELTAAAVPVNSTLHFVKYGLAGWRNRPDWPSVLAALLQNNERRPKVVIAAYADAEPARAPAVEEVVAFACQWPGAGFLLDTFSKSRLDQMGKPCTLLDWLPRAKVMRICQRLRQAGLQTALAGSLREEQFSELHEAAPDWFAVRGAACAGGERESTVSVRRVRRLAKALHTAAKTVCAG